MKKNVASVSQRLTFFFGALSIGLLIGLSIQLVQAWTNPTATPPGGNVSGPINTGAASQTKAGQLNITGGGVWGHGGITIGGQTLSSEGPWLYIGDAIGGVYGTPTQGLAAGNLWAQNSICLAGDCRAAWPTGGDNLGNHIATQDLNMAQHGIYDVPWIIIQGWDAVIETKDQGRDSQLIGTYRGWDANAVYIAGYNSSNNAGYSTNKVIVGGSGSVLPFFVTGGIYSNQGIIQSQNNGRGDLYFITAKGSLPGYPNDYYPTLGTSGTNLYFAGGGAYNGAIGPDGMYARIYRDLDDSTNYYVNPNGTSIVNNLIVKGFSLDFRGGDFYMGGSEHGRQRGRALVSGDDTTGKWLYVNYAGDFANGVYIGSTNVLISNNGGVSAKYFYYSSDETLKKDIVTLPHALEDLNSMRGVSFRWKKDDSLSIGVIAQEVEKVYPELVHTDEKGLKSVQYGNLVGPIIQAIKELSEKVEGVVSSDTKQNKELEEQRRTIEELKSEIRLLKAVRE